MVDLVGGTKENASSPEVGQMQPRPVSDIFVSLFREWREALTKQPPDLELGRSLINGFAQEFMPESVSSAVPLPALDAIETQTAFMGGVISGVVLTNCVIIKMLEEDA